MYQCITRELCSVNAWQLTEINTASPSHFQHLSTRHRRSRRISGCVGPGVSLCYALPLAATFHITSRWANGERALICRSVTEPVFCKILKTLSCLALKERLYRKPSLETSHDKKNNLLYFPFNLVKITKSTNVR